jgi:hypothetical protein
MLTYEERLNRDAAWALLEGSMHFEEKSAVHETLRNLTQSLNDLGIDYAIAGGMAMFLHGYRRFTEDVDVIVTREGLAIIHDELDGRGYIRPFEKSKNLRDTRTGVKIDFIISGQFPGDGKPGPVAFPIPSTASIEQDGIRVVTLPKLVELKLASGQAPHRLQDLGDVQQLIRHLHLPPEFAEELDASLRDTFRKIWSSAQSPIGEEY